MNSDANKFFVSGSSALQVEEAPAGHVISFEDAARRFGVPASPETSTAAGCGYGYDEAFVPEFGDPFGIKALIDDAYAGVRSGALAGAPLGAASWKVAASIALCTVLGLIAVLVAL